jgi:hypothetical protein
MTIRATQNALIWKELYQQAMVETDLAKLPPMIADAHRALLDRIEETLKKPFSAEQQELNDALNGLRTLRHELNAWTNKGDKDNANLRKTG